MSFLNPVSEPVLRFSSTDVGAPQINYNARVAGDIKTVLKGCLVTGYGAKASAGWTAVNETATVIEFVSPSVAMSDYRLGVDDTSAASTTWYYTHLNVRVNPEAQNLSKNHRYISTSSASNGWQLLVTDVAIIFVELLWSNTINNLVSRVAYLGQIKSALINNTGVNMAFWSLGHTGGDPTEFFKSAPFATLYSYDNGGFNRFGNKVSAINAERASDTTLNIGALSSAEIVAPWYIYNKGVLLGEQPAVMLRDINNPADNFGVYDTVFNNRPVLSCCVTYPTTTAENYQKYSRTLLISLDYWEC